jgi:hypothetical protein
MATDAEVPETEPLGKQGGIVGMDSAKSGSSRAAMSLVSVEAKQRISWWIRSGFEHLPTLASSVVTQGRLPRNVALDPVDS